MSTTHPAGRRIRNVGGLLESRTEHPPIEGYTAVFELDDGSVILVAQNDFATTHEWPSEAVSLPSQVVDGDAAITGETILAAFRTLSNTSSGTQLFFLLDSRRIAGLVNTARGTVLHVESVLAAPALRGTPHLWDVDGGEFELDDLLAL